MFTFKLLKHLHFTAAVLTVLSKTAERVRHSQLHMARSRGIHGLVTLLLRLVIPQSSVSNMCTWMELMAHRLALQTLRPRRLAPIQIDIFGVWLGFMVLGHRDCGLFPMVCHVVT